MHVKISLVNKTVEIRNLSRKYAYASIQMHETIARSAGFSGTDHKYLGFFLQRGKLTAGELSQLTGLTTGSVTALIDRFEKKGLVQRSFDPSDRRKVFIVPETDRILALLEPYYRRFRDETDAIISSFSDAEKEVIERYLTKSLQLANDTMEILK